MKTKSIFFFLPIIFATILVGSSLIFSAQAQVQAATRAPNATFTVTQITANTVEDLTPAMVADGNGKLHIAYAQNGTTTYMTNASGNWVTTTIGTESTEFNPSIAIDDAGFIHISYYGNKGVTDPDYAIYYATNAPNGNWNLDYVTTFTDMNTCHSTGGIAVDGAGSPYIVYTTYDGTNYQIEMRYYDNSRSSNTTISPTGGWTTGFSTNPGSENNYPSIAVENDGTVHLAYQTYKAADGSTDIHYTTNASGSWVSTAIPGADYEHETSPSIAIDSQGKAHIAYSHFDMSSSEVKYVTNAGGPWTSEDVTNGGDTIMYDRPSITLDNQGKVHIAIWSHNTSYYVTHATNASGTWAMTGMHINDTNLTEMDRAITVDPEGYVHIVHSATGSDHELYHAKSDQSFGAAENGTCTLPRTITCGEQVAGDTSGLQNNISGYGCSTWNESGPEEIWAFSLAAGSNYSITAELLGVSADLDIFLIDPGGCDSGACLGSTSFGDWDASVSSLPGGNTYFVAVDGFAGAQGSYTMRLNCEIIPGENFPITPHTPQPTNGSTNISIQPSLSWVTGDADGDTITGKVYGSTSNPPLIEPENLWCSDNDQGNPVTQSCAAPSLLPNTTYYWRVEVFDGGESVDGPIWSFTTTSNPTYKIFLPLVIR